jgi:hypothetical protein
VPAEVPGGAAGASNVKLPSTLDLVLYGLLALAVAGAVAVVGKWKHDAGLLKVERAAHVAELKRVNGELATERHNAQLARESSNAYQQALEDLRGARAATPARVVRLCHATTELPGAAGGFAAPGEEAVPDPARSDLEAGPDIGGPLYTLADEADECAVQRDALIDWITRTARVH